MHTIPNTAHTHAAARPAPAAPTGNPRELIAESGWIGCLTAAQRRRVETDVIVRNVPKDGSVCRNGEPVSHWIGVLDGLITVATASSAGKVATFSALTAGSWFGEESLLKREPWRYDVIALRASHVTYLPRPTFIWLLDNNASFSRFVLEHTIERLAQAMVTIEHGRLFGADGRVAHCLAELLNAKRFAGNDMALEISQEEIGHLAGLSRQRVNLSLKALEDAGLLRVAYRGVSILDINGLRHFDR